MKQIQFTPDNIQELKTNEVFVFGSNLLGNHAGGAARIAVEKFGAINGNSIGLQGQSYAIPTLDANMDKISIDLLLSYLTGLNLFASENKDKIFYVTKIGCGIAGFDEIEIARLFQSIQWSKNVILPQLFDDAKLTDFVIKLKNNGYSYRFENERLFIDEENGSVDLSSGNKTIKTPYLKRFNIEVNRNKIILFKRVSSDYKTQEGQKWETVWKVGTKLTHPNWNPTGKECGEGKFHACAKPSWCDAFRKTKGDRYIAIEVHIKDLFEWTDNPSYPTKIAFRECRVLYECDRIGNPIE